MSFSSYLVGTWEKRFSVQTTLQIINPTDTYLNIIVAFLDNNEVFQNYINSKEPLNPNKPLSPNEMWEVDIPYIRPEFGVVKIISHKNGVATPGIIGFQRHFLIMPASTIPTPPPLPEIGFAEAPLAAVPERYAQGEYDRILQYCPSS